MTARPTPGAGDVWGANLNAWLDETFATKAATSHLTDTAAHAGTFVPVAGGTFTGDVLFKSGKPWVDVRAYGAVGDSRLMNDANMTAGSAIVSSPNTSPFLSTDVGKVMGVAGAGSAGAQLVTTIASYQNAAQVTLAAAASTTVNGAWMHFGTDDTAAFQAAIDSFDAYETGVLFIPAAGPPISTSQQRGYMANLDLNGNKSFGIVGAGPGSIIRGKPGVAAPVIDMSTSYFAVSNGMHKPVFRDFRIQGDGAVHSSRKGWVMGTAGGNCAIDSYNVCIDYTGGIGLDLGGGVELANFYSLVVGDVIDSGTTNTPWIRCRGAVNGNNFFGPMLRGQFVGGSASPAVGFWTWDTDGTYNPDTNNIYGLVTEALYMRTGGSIVKAANTANVTYHDPLFFDTAIVAGATDTCCFRGSGLNLRGRLPATGGLLTAGTIVTGHINANGYAAYGDNHFHLSAGAQYTSILINGTETGASLQSYPNLVVDNSGNGSNSYVFIDNGIFVGGQPKNNGIRDAYYKLKSGGPRAVEFELDNSAGQTPQTWQVLASSAGELQFYDLTADHYPLRLGVGNTMGFYRANPVGRSTGWGAATGASSKATFDTSTVTTAQLAERVKALLDYLISRGDIGA